MVELKIKNFRGHDNGLFLFESIEAIGYLIEPKTLRIKLNEAHPLLQNGETYENDYCVIRQVEKSKIKRIGMIKNQKLIWQDKVS